MGLFGPAEPITQRRLSRAARVHSTVPNTLVSTSRRISSTDSEPNGPAMPTATASTHTSIRADRCTASRANRSTAAGSAISVGTTSTRPPRCRQSRSTSASASSLRDASTKQAPPAANANAVARPTPLDAPVITTTASRKFLRLATTPPPAKRPNGSVPDSARWRAPHPQRRGGRAAGGQQGPPQRRPRPGSAAPSPGRCRWKLPSEP
jgi:hypothetical protein